MKVAITADWHLRASDLDSARLQLLEMTKRSEGCDLLCVAGDVFDSPSIGDARTTGAIVAVAIEAVAAYPRSLLILGNHDYAGAGSADALHVFDGMPEVTVAREPQGLKSNRFPLIIQTIPWSWGVFPELPDQIPQCDVLLGHLRIGGALMSGKTTYDQRDSEFTISRTTLEQIPAKRIALGDFHRRQDLTGRGGYVGALRQLNFGEEGNPQGFEIVDTDTWQVEWIELSQCPYHRTVEINPGEPVPEQKANERLRVRYLAIPDPDEVRALEAEGVIVQHVTEREERVRRAEIPPGVMHDKRELIRLWASSQEPPVGDERLERMLTVYGEAL